MIYIDLPIEKCIERNYFRFADEIASGIPSRLIPFDAIERIDDKPFSTFARFLTEKDKRTCYCAQLTEEYIGQEVCVMGWVQKQRDLGGLIFIDLRDRTGIVQLAFDNETDKEILVKPLSFPLENGIMNVYK